MRYRVLMERFQHVVRFGANAHTHFTQFELVNSFTNPGTPVMLNFVTGSIDTWDDTNPQFAVFELDQDTLLPVDYKIHAFELDKANADPQTPPAWYNMFDYKQTYGIDDLSPRSMKQLAKRILNDPETASLYHWNTHGQSGPKPAAEGYDSLEDYCDLTSEIYEYYECQQTNGQANSKFGAKPKILSINILNCFVDRYVIGNWIEVTPESQLEEPSD